MQLNTSTVHRTEKETKGATVLRKGKDGNGPRFRAKRTLINQEKEKKVQTQKKFRETIKGEGEKCTQSADRGQTEVIGPR